MFKNVKINSLNQSKIRNYLLYAIGEIILVVIGILIAIQVNNGNMNSIQKQQEIKMLKEINDALISDTMNIKYFSERIKVNTKSIGALLDVITNDEPYHDSLDYYFAKVVTPFMWSESSSAYQTLLSKGIDIISNDEIRTAIIAIHTSHFETIKYLDDGIYLKYPYIHEYCLKHFDVVGSEAIDESGHFIQGRMKPYNYKELITDPEYRTILKTVKGQQEILLMYLQGTKNQLKMTIDKINLEIAQ